MGSPLRTRLFTLFGALLLTVLASAFAGASASAAPVTAAAGIQSTCPADSVCLYVDRDFGGNVFVVPAGQSFPNVHLFACPGCDSPKHGAGDGNFGDQMSAWVNNTSWAYCWFYDINYGSFMGVMNAGNAVTWVGKRAQDELSSIRPC